MGLKLSRNGVQTGFWEIAPPKSTSHQLVNLTGDAQTAEVRNGRRPNTSLETVPGKVSHSKFLPLSISSLKSSILPTLSTIRRTTNSIGSRALAQRRACSGHGGYGGNEYPLSDRQPPTERWAQANQEVWKTLETYTQTCTVSQIYPCMLFINNEMMAEAADSKWVGRISIFPILM